MTELQPDVYLKTVYADKEKVKSLGGHWNPDLGLWYVPHGVDLLPFASHWDIFIHTKYIEKEEVKARGGRWDPEHKMWYIPVGSDLSQFRKWLPLNSIAYDPVDFEAKQISDTNNHAHKLTPQPLIINNYYHISPIKMDDKETTNVIYEQISSVKAEAICHFTTYQLSDIIRQFMRNQCEKMSKSELVNTCLSLKLLRTVIVPVDTSYEAALTSNSEPSLTELKDIAKRNLIKGYSRMSKTDLLQSCLSINCLKMIVVRGNSASDKDVVLDPPASPTNKRSIDSIVESIEVSKKPHILHPSFKCPITSKLMHDPVICSDGFSYERSAIEEWLEVQNISPKTHEPLTNGILMSNLALKNAIKECFGAEVKQEPTISATNIKKSL
mmetsp:Transcript_37063/g.37727  ORF Transcript_37063/g.37727 Transcript_37063/m.37727 type:complete len:383 (-) Transcript_37063:180-1328(-)|eukprot:CAMPEP_0182427674 /NCGR_PEP_ID=MMETSP1167-20130531/18977_1 /TAXON_ID=2988 /ORGANISM="Mallomonas Sp, Strain CCMP3275" /LENGTH=382 /DNA_ID=CAMNT_0024610097 /DNA_START=176 /DNA_END=1324 /DNA_ORIENTATION=+